MPPTGAAAALKCAWHHDVCCWLGLNTRQATPRCFTWWARGRRPQALRAAGIAAVAACATPAELIHPIQDSAGNGGTHPGRPPCAPSCHEDLLLYAGRYLRLHCVLETAWVLSALHPVCLYKLVAKTDLIYVSCIQYLTASAANAYVAFHMPFQHWTPDRCSAAMSTGPAAQWLRLSRTIIG